jgi:pyrroline-5-carboxylate reductase
MALTTPSTSAPAAFQQVTTHLTRTGINRGIFREVARAFSTAFDHMSPESYPSRLIKP